jgi:hypothetical protein
MPNQMRPNLAIADGLGLPEHVGRAFLRDHDHAILVDVARAAGAGLASAVTARPTRLVPDPMKTLPGEAPQIRSPMTMSESRHRSCIASLYGSAYAINCAPSTRLTATTMYCLPLIM